MYARVFKRWLDVVLASSALMALIPFLAVAALVIRLEDGGPVIFRQRRVGRNGELFTLYKLRSMPIATPNVPSAAGQALRVTRVGRVIRRTNLDELPQLFNIIKGDMSLVGPRPALPTQTSLIELRQRRFVMDVRPGLTGLAQVNAYDGMPESEKVEWERRYLEKITFFGDLDIIGRTVGYLMSPPPVY